MLLTSSISHFLLWFDNIRTLILLTDFQNKLNLMTTIGVKVNQ
jgi:hypothetical protein